jgi:uncharacterized phosphosugar-binding protein
MSIRRRHFLAAVSAAAATLPFFAPGCGSTSAGGRSYAEALRAILDAIVANEAPSIRDTANLLADTIIARNRCFLYTGHRALSRYLTAPGNGLPRVLIPLLTGEMADTVREGDIVCTTHTTGITDTAASHGARIIPLSSAASASDANRRGGHSPAIPSLDAHLPSDGIVAHPGLPSGILPGTFPVLASIITAVAGETYRRSGGIGLTGATRPTDALAFLNITRERISAIGTQPQHGMTTEAAGILAQSVRRGGRVLVYDSTVIAHGEIAEGPGVPSFLEQAVRENFPGDVHDHDAVIVLSASSNRQEDLAVVRAVRGSSHAVVSICPRDEEGGYRLFKEATAGLDNYSYERDGVLSYEFESKRFLKTAAILNSAVFWQLIDETVTQLVDTGYTPQFT